MPTGKQDHTNEEHYGSGEEAKQDEDKKKINKINRKAEMDGWPRCGRGRMRFVPYVTHTPLSVMRFRTVIIFAVDNICLFFAQVLLWLAGLRPPRRARLTEF